MQAPVKVVAVIHFAHTLPQISPAKCGCQKPSAPAEKPKSRKI
jgi:hypothetical protein